MDRDIDYLVSQIGKLQDRLSEVEQRHERLNRPGTAEQIDPKKKLVRIRIGGTDKAPMLSPWVPYSQVSGGLFQEHKMPQVGQPSNPSPESSTEISSSGDLQTGASSGGIAGGGAASGSGTSGSTKKGQTFMFHSPDGDFEQGYAVPFTFSNDNPSPSNDPTKIALQHVDSQQDPKKRTVKWDTAGDHQVQVIKANHHLTEHNHNLRVNDSRDGTDSLKQETDPQEQKKDDQVHYSDTDGKNGLTRAVNNDAHKITIHPSKGIQSSVNNKQQTPNQPGPPSSQQSNTHSFLLDLAKGLIGSVMGGKHGISIDDTGKISHLVGASQMLNSPGFLGSNPQHSTIIDIVKGIIHSVSNGQHSITIDPSKGITHQTSATHTTNAAQSIIDAAASIIHNGATKVNSTLNVSQLISGQGGASITTGSSPSFSITRAGGVAAGGFEIDALEITDGLDVSGGLIADKIWSNLPNFINLAAARAAGLTAGRMYQINGTVMIVPGLAMIESKGVFFIWGNDAELTYQSGIQPFEADTGEFGFIGSDATMVYTSGA